MNFLAHFLLSGKDEALIVGNFLGDFLTNREVASLPDAVRKGITLHRQIDTFTDRHPAVLQSVQRLRPVHGRYSPVLLDVFYDFILANNWVLYCSQNLGDFASEKYEILQRHLHLMPDFLQERLPLMIADDWLVRYGTEDGLRFTFNRMKMRASKPAYFEQAVESLKNQLENLQNDFNFFFPEAVKQFVSD